MGRDDARRLEIALQLGERSESLSSTATLEDHIQPAMLEAAVPRWADKACQDIKYIDDDTEDARGDLQTDRRDTVFCSASQLSAREIMRSTQLLAELDHTTVSAAGSADLIGSAASPSLLAQLQSLPTLELAHKKRVILSKPPAAGAGRSKTKKGKKEISVNVHLAAPSGDASSVKENSNSSSSSSLQCSRGPSLPFCQSAPKPTWEVHRRGSLDCVQRCKSDSVILDNAPPNHSASLPASPVHKLNKPKGKKTRSKQELSGAQPCSSKLLSPFTSARRRKSSRAVDSSDDEVNQSGEDVTTCENYKNLETFQKAQLNKKLRKVRTRGDGETDRGGRSSPHRSPHSSPHHSAAAATAVAPLHQRQVVMHNKAPMWNENSQVYQLDFGGRVTQESAKNFQIEFRGKQVMQFGRIDSNAYTLDFQYPFSAIQAFSVALANVTQRLK